MIRIFTHVRLSIALLCGASTGFVIGMDHAAQTRVNQELLNAAYEGNAAAVTHAVEHGAQVNHFGVASTNNKKADAGYAYDTAQYTPLFIAARQGHLAVVKNLLEHGAQVNLGARAETKYTGTYQYTATPLHAVVHACNREIAGPLAEQRIGILNLLIQKGASLHKKDFFGKTPFDYWQPQDGVTLTQKATIVHAYNNTKRCKYFMWTMGILGTAVLCVSIHTAYTQYLDWLKDRKKTFENDNDESALTTAGIGGNNYE